jgi:hypothetical protein
MYILGLGSELEGSDTGDNPGKKNRRGSNVTYDTITTYENNVSPGKDIFIYICVYLYIWIFVYVFMYMYMYLWTCV